MTEAKRLALVTGASGGIGLELAKQFVLHNYDLVVCAEEEAIHQAADALGVSGAVITPVQVDLRTYDSVESLYSAVKGTGRPLDAAALNAGVGLGGPFATTPRLVKVRRTTRPRSLVRASRH
jgi:NAD(P)-dependent dehydrogenase (short-subunit alcohol dehydrogenase family)